MSSLVSLKEYEIVDKSLNSVIVGIESFDINKGDIVFILGDNGSGKSTFIKSLFSVGDDKQVYYSVKSERAIANLKNGKVMDLIGKSEIDLGDYHLFVSCLDQNDSFCFYDSITSALRRQSIIVLDDMRKKKKINKDEYLSIKKNIDNKVKEYSLRFLKKDFGKKIQDNEEKFLKYLKKKRVKQCSYGQQKLISLLATLIKTVCLNCELLVMDEPLNHLDSYNKIIVKDLLNEIISERKDNNDELTLIMISHCLVFDFINSDNCYQYEIKDNKLVKLKEKIFHTCLKNGSC